MSSLLVSLLIFLLTGWLAVLTFLLYQIHLQNRPKPKSLSGLRHWSLLRFNPFSDTGGSHSFIITLLDETKNGIILTSLHGRGVTRFYAKQVMDGKADQDLSEEEKKALHQALRS